MCKRIINYSLYHVMLRIATVDMLSAWPLLF